MNWSSNGSGSVDTGVPAPLLHAWLAGRSIARGLPAPVADRGGYRVDTASETEIRRWVFAGACDGLAALGRSVDGPRQVLKLCGSDEQLRSMLSDRWQSEAPAFFMQARAVHPERPLPAGYTIEIERAGAVTTVRIRCPAGSIAASGHAAETADAFVYDRIAVAADHRRRGLGHVLMTALQQAKQGSATPELLVATVAGRALYTRLGWQTLSPYSTASIPG